MPLPPDQSNKFLGIEVQVFLAKLNELEAKNIPVGWSCPSH